MAEMDVPRPKSDGHDRTGSVATFTKAAEPQESVSVGKDTDDEKPSAISTPLTADSSEPPTNDFKPESDIDRVPGRQRGEADSVRFGGEDNDPVIPVAYPRTGSPTSVQRSMADSHRASKEVINRMHKYSLYQTNQRYYLVGADIMDKHYRLLKIDRTSPPGQLNIFEDEIIYSKREMNQLLNAIDDGNKGNGGMKLKCSAWGLLGFIRFTEVYYMLLITKRAQVAMVGGHYIYQVDDTEMIPLTTRSSTKFQNNTNPEEARFLGILNNLDLTRSFYFSYSYNITRSLQQNMIRERTAVNDGFQRAIPDFQDMFVWNHHLLDPAHTVLKNVFDWCHPIIHGYIDQSSLDIYGRKVYITIIARRSRFFAGARFLKRGANDLGYVANDVETEQIVSDALNTSFHAPGPRLYANPNYTSYVQHRGSIPLHWTQDNTGVTPKPDIDLNLIDPFFTAAALHFDHLFERYGSPIYVLNLVKARERTPRESKLSVEYKRGIDYLNQSLPDEHKIKYEAFDMSRASKTRGQDVIGTLEHLAEKVLRVTDFFHNGQEDIDAPRLQSGVARTNCIDCLDRTNAAQFVIGKRALGRQLQVLGVISGKTVEYDTDCVEIFTRMFHNHGDQIAVQYGGSHLVNTMATYRKINHWQSSSRDMVESFKRYYHNSFLDSQRQEAYNLFLGNYIYIQGQPMLWDLATDYYLHHEDPRFWLSRLRRDYISWYSPQHFNRPALPPAVPHKGQRHLTHAEVANHDDYWLEYYRPLALSSFLKIFAFRLNEKSAPQRPEKFIPMHPEDFSPFVVRKKPHDQTSPGKGIQKPQRKGVTIVDPNNETDSLRNSIAARRPQFQSTDYDSPAKHSILRDTHFETAPTSSTLMNRVTFPSITSSTASGFALSTPTNFIPADKGLVNQWTLTQFYENSLNPSVPASEQDEYSRYISHPLNLPLVVSSETPSADDPSALEFYEYLSMTETNVPPLGMPDFPTGTRQAQSAFPRSASFSISRPASAAGFSINTPFSHHPAYESLGMDNSVHVPGSNKFQVSDDDLEEFEDYVKVEENPLDVLEEDGGKKRYKAYRQWLRGKSFFKQSKVDPEWQNQLPVR